MGMKPVGADGEFARLIAEHVNRLIVESGSSDVASGRWLSARTGRSAGYWVPRQTIKIAYTVSDIDQIAKIFGKTPFEFIQEATMRGDSNVSG